MSSETLGTAAQEEQSKHLRASYRKAFSEWAAQVGEVLAVRRSDSGSNVSRQAEVQVEKAAKTYHEARNLMADDMIARHA